MPGDGIDRRLAAAQQAVVDGKLLSAAAELESAVAGERAGAQHSGTQRSMAQQGAAKGGSKGRVGPCRAAPHAQRAVPHPLVRRAGTAAAPVVARWAAQVRTRATAEQSAALLEAHAAAETAALA